METTTTNFDLAHAIDLFDILNEKANSDILYERSSNALNYVRQHIDELRVNPELAESVWPFCEKAQTNLELLLQMGMISAEQVEKVRLDLRKVVGTDSEFKTKLRNGLQAIEQTRDKKIKCHKIKELLELILTNKEFLKENADFALVVRQKCNEFDSNINECVMDNIISFEFGTEFLVITQEMRAATSHVAEFDVCDEEPQCKPVRGKDVIFDEDLEKDFEEDEDFEEDFERLDEDEETLPQYGKPGKQEINN